MGAFVSAGFVVLIALFAVGGILYSDCLSGIGVMGIICEHHEWAVRP